MQNVLNTKIPKFRRCIIQDFPFIENTFDALTDYQLLCKVVEYLNKVIAQQNTVTEQTVQLTNAFDELTSYVEHYFDNLDVQEEVNNKLDEMVEDGTFRELLADTVQFVSYEMFGATLDGTTDDTSAVIAAHNYANLHNLPVVQKRGIVYMPTASISNCPIINTDCDLTGCTFKYDSNNDNDTVLIIADPNTLTNDRSSIQSTELSSSQISALSDDNTNPITFLQDYTNNYVVFETDMEMGTRTSGNHEDIYYSQGFQVDDYGELTPNNMYADIADNATTVTMKYLPLSQSHIQIKLPKILITGNTENNPMIVTMRNNVELLDCIIEKTNYNNYTEWYQPLFRCRYCCNVTVKNFVGENISSEEIGDDQTSYIIAFDKCYNVLFDNNNLIKGHGCFVSYFCNFMNFTNNVIDRFDNHYGLFGTVNITNCSFISRPSRINLGFGNGSVNITNCAFYKYDERGSQVSPICIDFRTDLAVMYAGNVTVDNVYIKGINLVGNDRFVTLIQWIPTKDENTTFPTFGNYHVPNMDIKNVRFDTGPTYYRTFNIHNNNVNDVDYVLGTIVVDSSQARPNTSVMDFTQVNTDSDAKIVLNGERVQLICGTATVPVYLKDNNTFRSQDNNTNVICHVEGDNNVIRGTFKELYINGYTTSNGAITVTDITRNSGRLYISNSLTTNKLESNGNLAGEELTVTEGFVSSYFNVKKITVGTKLAITGAYVEILNSVTNNGQIYLTGNYMFSSVAGKFNNGTIHGNGNWGGDNSSYINTLT